MKMKNYLTASLTILAALLLAGGALAILNDGAAFAEIMAYAPLSWWTVDSGGGRISGTGYLLNGTAGQPDAGTLTGGNYTLAGGYWAGAAAVQPSPGSLLYLPLLRR